MDIILMVKRGARLKEDPVAMNTNENDATTSAILVVHRSVVGQRNLVLVAPPTMVAAVASLQQESVIQRRGSCSAKFPWYAILPGIFIGELR